MVNRRALNVLLALPMLAATSFALGDDMSLAAGHFVKQNCADCHTGNDGEGGFNIDALTGNLGDRVNRDQWVRVIDRVEAGEMPPADAGRIAKRAIERFVDDAGGSILAFEKNERATRGRVFARRLTNLQLERSLHDVLGIDIPLADLLPEEQRTGGYTTVASGQTMSHFDLENHMGVVDAALNEAFRRISDKPDEWTKELTPEQLCNRKPNSRNREPEVYKDMAVVWSHGLVFYGRIAPTTAREDGWYRFTFDTSSLNTPDYGVWTTVRTGECRSSAPSMTEWAIFQATEEKQTVTVEAWLPRGHMFEVKPQDSRTKKARTEGGQVGTGECVKQNVSGVGIHKATLSRFHKGPDNKAIRRILFDNVSLKWDKASKSFELDSRTPAADLERLMLRFAERAFRRPVEADQIAAYVDLAKRQLEDGGSLMESLRDGYRSLLCSPRFMYLVEEPGELDDHALACRLSYFLWNTMPDEELRKLADEGKLANDAELSKQMNRMLADEKGKRFVVDFADQWLDLCDINFTEPDRRLYRDFDLTVQLSMLEETHRYLQALLERDLSVSNLIDSDFTFLNERLATYYGAKGNFGQEMRPVPIPEDHPRGGLLTQGAVLKVTANGTTTSPVIRGVWVSERLMGIDIPDPPKNVPAVEPDIRGAKTIRDQLEKHKSDAACAVCHRNIDPPGYALENFDPAGQWRLNYPSSNKKKGPLVDASYELPDGDNFRGVVEFQQIVARNRAQLARNLASQFITYGTGAPIGYSDRVAVDNIMSASRREGFGFRTILEQFVLSPIFREK